MEITLKIKYSDFTLQTRSKTLPYYVSDAAVILDAAKMLLYQDTMDESVRLLGVSLSNLNTVGTITTGVWSSTIVDVAHGGTGLTKAGLSG